MTEKVRSTGLDIVCCDGLRGMPDAITATWPQATVQTCVVHLVRNSLRYASKAHWSQIAGDMRTIYTAPTVEAAEARFAEFTEKWAERYPAMIKVWERAWPEFVPFLEFPPAIRKVIYTTNADEISETVGRNGRRPPSGSLDVPWPLECWEKLPKRYLTLRELVTDQVQVHPWPPTAIIATSFASADRGEDVNRPEG